MCLDRARRMITKSISGDLDSIFQWRKTNFVILNGVTTQCIPFSLKHSQFERDLTFENVLIVPGALSATWTSTFALT